MTTFRNAIDLTREAQDSIERHGFKEVKFGDGGATVSVEGNGTADNDCVVLSLGGVIHHLKPGTDAEVILIGNGDDTNGKFALITGPRDKQYKSKPGQSWGQNPTDPNERVGYTEKGVRFASAKSIADMNGLFEIRDGKIYVRCEMVMVQPPTIGTPPAFEAE